MASGGPVHFEHEQLDAYRLMLDIARWAGGVAVPASRKHLRDQQLRAVDSAVLNIAEGASHPRGDARRNHYRIALGSAAEASAALDLIRTANAEARREDLRRVGAMLAVMARL
jgi:four helix bundle protein